jgi:hypothetical protein
MKPVYTFQSITMIILLLLLSVTLPQGNAFAQNIGGIGAQLFLDTSEGFTMPRIMALIPNTPADKFLKATDFIMKVNDMDCKNKTIEEVVGVIRGEAGTTVKITVADTKEGKHQREYDLTRVSMQTGVPPNGGTAPPPDPLTAFYTDCENEVKQMKRKGIQIIKTYTSECGNYFFNFNAETAGAYHIRLMAMQEKTNLPAGQAGTDTIPGFYPTARIFDGDNEAAAITLSKTAPKPAENPASGGTGMMIAQLEGDLGFKKSGVGVISVQIHDDVKKCRGMYIVVYK